ncbi:MAG TPA: hypothetical protein V6D30_06335 [Leptolyngbyaceae cyanobacterium]|jgi:hypothetical protein
MNLLEDQSLITQAEYAKKLRPLLTLLLGTLPGMTVAQMREQLVQQGNAAQNAGNDIQECAV